MILMVSVVKLSTEDDDFWTDRKIEKERERKEDTYIDRQKEGKKDRDLKNRRFDHHRLSVVKLSTEEDDFWIDRKRGGKKDRHIHI